MKIDTWIGEYPDKGWMFDIKTDIDTTGFSYPLQDVRKTPEDAAWAMMATLNELNFWFWQQNQMEIQF